MSFTTIDARPKGLLAHLREGRGAAPWTGRRWLALVLLVVVPLVAMAGLFSASAAHADGDDKNKQMSFYSLASATTAFFSDTAAPDGESGKRVKQMEADSPWLSVTQNPANAGSMLGWADPDFDLSISWLTSSLSGTSDALSYQALMNTGSEFTGLVNYAHFGATLNGLGLDSMGTGLSLGFFEFIGGGIMALLYLMAVCVDVIFSGFVSILALLNPFKLLFEGIENATFADGMVGGDPNRTVIDDRWVPAEFGDFFTTAFAGLASFVSGIYKAINGIAWGLMVPLFLALFLFSLLSFKKMNRGGAIKKLLVRIAFIGLGVPLLGMMYTGTVNSMAEATKAGNMGATQVVLSTYVDFEKWANNQRLAIPENATIEWNVGRSQPSANATMKVRDTALAINAFSDKAWSSVTPLFGGDNSVSWSSSVVGSNDNGHAGSAYVAVMDMLTRYMTGAKVEAAAFENQAKGSITSWMGNDEGRTKKAASWFSDIRDTDEVDKVDPRDNPVLTSSAGLTVSGDFLIGDNADGVDPYSIVKTFSTQGVSSSCGASVMSSDGSPRACNLAPLAMYNYLNTSFGSESMTTYSSQKVMSGATRESHNSVSQVGSGVMGGLYWLNSVVLLAAFVTIGLGYGIALVIGNIRRGIQTISSIPFAALGALAAIGKVIVYTFAMILEIVLTLFLYKLVQELLIAIPKIVEYPFSAMLSNPVAENAGFIAFLTSGGAITIVVTLLSIITVIAFTVMAMRVRKSLLKAIEEAITKLVEKLTDASVGGPLGGKMAPALAGGLAAGAGAAAANKMMSGGAKAPGGLAAGVPGAGPGGVGVAGGVTGGTDGGDSALAVGGEIETGDGTLAVEGGGGPNGPAPGNGDPGSPLELTMGPGGDSAAAETAEGKRVEAEGLSPDGGAPAAGGTDGGYAVDANGDAVPAKDVQAGESAVDGISDSMEESAEGYKAADKQRLAAGTEGAQAVGHGALAVGRAYAGDAAGAAESAGRAVEHGGNTVAAGERAKQAEQDAGRSSLDKPSTKHADRAQKAQQVSQVGGTVANAAGAASATGGAAGGAGKAASQGAGAAKAPAKAPQAPRAPQQQAPRAPQQQAPRAPQQQAPRAPQQQRQAPAPQAPRPQQQAPRQQQAQRPAPAQSQRPTVVNNTSVDRSSKVVNKRKKKIAPPKSGKGQGKRK